MSIKVPVYGPQQAQVNPAGPTSMNQQRAPSAATFGVEPRNGGALGRTLTMVGGTLLDLNQEYQKTRAEQALLEFENDRTALLMDAKTGYFNTQGQAAFEGKDAVLKQLNEKRKAKVEQMDNPVARALFTQASDVLLMNDEREVNDFAARNMQAWKKSVAEQVVNNSFSDAVRYWNNPEQLGVALQRGKDAVVDQGDGMGTEWINNAVDDYTGRFYKAVVATGIGKSFADGQAMLAEFGDLLDPEDEIVLRDQLERKEQAENAQRISASAVSTAANMVDNYWEYDNARETIYTKLRDRIDPEQDPELFDRTLAEANQLLNIRLSARDEQRSAIVGGIAEAAVNGVSVDQWIASNGDQWAVLSAEQRARLLAKPDIAVKTDARALIELSKMTDDQLLQLDPTEYIDRLSIGELNKLLTKQQELRNPKPSDDKVEPNVGWTTNAQISAAMESVFGDDVKYEEMNTFYGLVNEQLNFAARKKGSPLDYMERSTLIQEFTNEYVFSRESFFGQKEVTSRIDDINPRDALRYSQMLTASGGDASAQQILSLSEVFRTLADEDIEVTAEVEKDIITTLITIRESGRMPTVEQVMKLYTSQTNK